MPRVWNLDADFPLEFLSVALVVSHIREDCAILGIDGWWELFLLR
jgi:hypothetical protein